VVQHSLHLVLAAAHSTEKEKRLAKKREEGNLFNRPSPAPAAAPASASAAKMEKEEKLTLLTPPPFLFYFSSFPLLLMSWNAFSSGSSSGRRVRSLFWLSFLAFWSCLAPLSFSSRAEGPISVGISALL
jgi:hypothetical protein